MRHRLVGALGLGLVVSAGVAALFFVELDSPTLGRALLERTGAATGAKIEAAEFRLSLLRGLSLKQVRASGTAAGERYEVTLDRLIFAHRLLPLLSGRVWVDRVSLERPRVRLVETSRGPVTRKPKAVAASSATLPLALHVAEIAVEDGEIVTATRRVREIEATFQISKGRLDSRTVRFRTDEGPFEARVSADLGKLPFSYRVTLDGVPLDLNVVSGLSGRGGRFGPAHVALDGQGVGNEPRGLQGQGVLQLKAGTLPATPLLAAIEKTLGRTRIVGAAYKAAQTPYRVDDGRVTIERLRLEAETAGLDVGGSMGLEGSLDMNVAVRAPRDHVRIAGVPPEVLDTLTDESGWVRVPLRITGTRLSPRVAPDMAALGAQARQGGARVIEKKALDKLRRIFGGD